MQNKVVGIVLLVLGVMLALSTIRPLCLRLKEDHIHHTLQKRYEITEPDIMGSNTFDLTHNQIEIKETPQPNSVQLQVFLNDKALGEPIAATYSNDGKTYTKGVWVNVLQVHDKKARNLMNKERVVIVTHPEADEWQIYYINGNKEVDQARFSLDHRERNYLNILVVKYSGGPMIGYNSDINMSMNVLSYLIPIVIFTLSILMLLIGIFLIFRGRSKPHV